MVADIAGVVKEIVPVPPVNTAPPDAVANQSIVSPAFTLADISTVPVAHRCPSAGVFGATGIALTVAVTGILVAEMQPVETFLVSP